MARGTFLGRSRTIRQAEAGSSPTSKHPDVLPRKGQKCIEDGANNSCPAPHPNRSFHRPVVSEGHQQKRLQAMSPINTEAPPLPSSPISSPVCTNNDMNGSLIGVALGSPRMIDPQVPTSQIQETIPVKPAEPQARPSLQRKPSKWKKIGGLFKAKAAMTAPPNQPFYQVRLENEWPMQGSTYSFEQQPKIQTSGLESPASPTTGTDAWPSIVPEVQTSAQEPKQTHADATSGSPQEKEQSLGSGPLLQVDIPDIQLERYSVMFGGVLKKNRPSSMSRRSKNLEDTKPPAEEDIPHSPVPTRSKSPSPSFSLFPSTKTSKASKVLGSQNIPRGPSPIHKSQTSLGESNQETLSEKSSVVLMVHSSQPSHKQQNSVSSFLSSTTIGSEDERLLLQKLGPVRSYFDAREPEWEIINKKPTAKEPVRESPPSLRIDTQVDSPRTASYASSILSASSDTPVNAPRQRNEVPSPASRRTSPISPRREPSGDAKKDSNPSDPENPVPTVEISIARSVSVSKGKRQVLVPIRPRPDRLDPNERVGDKKGKAPQVMAADRNHLPGRSQEVLVDTI
ncbi:hypothetical protein BO79DRAFT_147569 [Aspergillus costaricaensis CBS 115574]|uniref:Uncharacterized protein n=1 Tax=Aspergillus costaricaensis CBS 115574 TaxID=1448317 RepID=A0ACD1IFH6_9EURO|nr:hypothetical protein BO79DRAFT_147569 [Aspergillus costaricaensis CBS 115574]RAK88994.1 hypothetical protein BO79DRAFT_147569 [Aspergillus costaricaensis CBS 115574]